MGPRRLDGLTQAERDVALLVTEGLTNREVGARLGISERTVDSRLQTIYRKLGLSRRHQLATWVAGEGGRRPEGGSRDRRLPSRRSSLVGRGEDLLDLTRLARAHQLVTITGPGGVGKTRLAVEAARLLEREFPLGVHLVGLSSTAEGDLVDDAALTALGLQHQTTWPARAVIADHLRPAPALLVVDSCEHVIEAAAALIDHLLAACDELRVIATSREPLLVDGEHVRQLSPLELPEPGVRLDGDALRRYAALQLFAERAAQAGARLPDRAADLELVADICRRLDGLPLALELAAARTPTMSLAVLLARLQDEEGLLVLGTSARTAEDRHRTLLATVEWSYGLLTRDERRLLARLSVFAGTFDAPAATRIGGLPPLETGRVVDLLSSLVSKSLVVGVPGADGGHRYRLLDTLRAFGHERLVAKGEEELVRQQQARHYADVLAEPTLSWTRVALDEYRDQLVDVRAALAWSTSNQPGLVKLICGRLVGFWGRYGGLAEGCQWMARILDRLPDDDMDRAVAYANGCWLAQRHGRFDLAERYALENLRIQHLVGDAASIADALSRVADVARNRGDAESARLPAREAVALFRGAGEPVDLALALMVWGSAEGRCGEFETGRCLIEEGAAIFASIGERSGVALCHGWQGELWLREGRLGRAREYLTAALRIFGDMPDGWMVANLLDLLGWLAAAERDPYRAVRLAGAASSVRHLIGASQPPALTAVLATPLQQARSSLGHRAERAWQEGASASVEQAIAYALRDEPGRPAGGGAAPPTPGGLTRREMDVVPLVAQGLSDREIATLLGISVRTAEYHLDRIRIKLGCGSRAQIAAWAVMQGVVPAAPR